MDRILQAAAAAQFAFIVGGIAGVAALTIAEVIDALRAKES